ncbi:hypothetical protein [Okeania sp. KiyG1]|uniref:hypothetical protein n=1 Tax=Okeania sp. KiyG1 TaxID=2720165 RepID=UPI001924D259|nr:hypothetical protein [Okeania sp. KiyG1]GGA11868.1 hypothetical protein CYANOKiyG1_24900 [Okeania sp. KiyG1]
MSDTSQSKRTSIKDRALIAADDDLIERAKKAMQELKIYPRVELAKITKLSLYTINKFFKNRKFGLITIIKYVKHLL